MDTYTNKSLSIPICLGKISGFALLDSTNDTTQYKRIFYIVYNLFMFLATSLLLICACVDLIFKIDDWSIAIFNLLSTLYIIHTMLRRIFGLFKSKQVLKIASEFRALEEFSLSKEFQKQCGQKLYRQFRIFISIYTSVFIIATTYWCTLPFIAQNKNGENSTEAFTTQVMASWYPFDYNATPGYELSIVFQVFVIYQNSLCITSCDGMIFAFFMLIHRELKRLRFAFIDMVRNSESRNKIRNRITEMMRNCDLPYHERYSLYDVVTTSMDHKCEGDKFTVVKKSFQEEQVKAQLCTWIQAHQWVFR